MALGQNTKPRDELLKGHVVDVPYYPFQEMAWVDVSLRANDKLLAVTAAGGHADNFSHGGLVYLTK